MTRRRRDRAPQRQVDYTRLRNPFPQMRAFSDDHIATMHAAALDLLEGQGIRVLLPEAVKLFASGGAVVNDDMVHIGRDMVAAALATAPRSVPLAGGVPGRDVVLELGSLVFQPGAGCPHATDRDRGRRPGTLTDYRELVQLTQAFDVMHMVPPLVEPQDVPTATRHLATLECALSDSDKVPFVYSRGSGQVAQSFELIAATRGLTDAAFGAQSHCYTIINTNSPRVIDMPMAQGLIDFARAGQVSIVTPFTLMGAMAPITVAGAITLSHAEALAAITLTQLARAGAPVCYGTFTSNVDMKSGAPVFGTPEHFRASLAAGQLARLIGLPWRSATGASGAVSDVQAAHETQMGLWGCLMAGATVVIHAAGWLEGGLSISYEKFITDMEVCQMVAELCMAGDQAGSDLALDALEEVAPGGHFFGAAHTMARYSTEFYAPFAADYANFGTWTEAGEIDATTRATGLWKDVLARAPSSVLDDVARGRLQDNLIRLRALGGAEPVS